MNTSDRPTDAGDYGAFLQRHGASAVPSENYEAERGDVAVFKGNRAHPHGHVQIYDGSQWISDFKQPRFDPYPQQSPGGPYTIYRFPGN